MAAEAGEAEALRHHALPGEGGVAVDQKRHDARPLVERHDIGVAVVGVLVLLGARLAEHHRVDDLEMRRVGGERQMHLVAVELAVGRGAEVILDVAGALDVVGRGRAALELVEDDAVRLGQHLGEHVQPAAMRHAEHDLLHAELRRRA